jgi:hypothetical protein
MANSFHLASFSRLSWRTEEHEVHEGYLKDLLILLPGDLNPESIF